MSNENNKAMTQKLTSTQEKLIEEIQKSSCQFVYRKFMSKEEIKAAESLVKLDIFYKSKPAEKNATIAYFSWKKY